MRGEPGSPNAQRCALGWAAAPGPAPGNGIAVSAAAKKMAIGNCLTGGDYTPPTTSRISSPALGFTYRPAPCGRFTPDASPRASSPQMTYQPMSTCHQCRLNLANPAAVW